MIEEKQKSEDERSYRDSRQGLIEHMQETQSKSITDSKYMQRFMIEAERRAGTLFPYAVPDIEWLEQRFVHKDDLRDDIDPCRISDYRLN